MGDRIMADTVTVPGLGPVKETYVWAGGALVIGVAGYAWWQYNRNREPVDFVGASPDDYGVSDYDSPLGSSGTNSTGDYSQLDPEAIDTNAKWTIDAADKLANRGYTSSVVLAALGKYLNRKGLTEAEIEIVQAAIAVSGPPPVGGPYPITNALPPPPSTGGGNTNPPPPTTSTLTKVTGISWVAIWTFAIELHWNKVNNATGYEIFVNGSSYMTTGTVTGVMLRNNIKPGTYNVTVRAKKGSETGPMSDAVSIKVPSAAEGGHTS